MGRLCACAVAIFLATGVPLPAAPPPSAFLQILREMHPDYSAFVREVRGGETRRHPEGILAGLVRPGGEDPGDPGDAPQAGTGARNDIIVYDDTFRTGASPAWQRLIVDHEYFHAKHLSQAADPPVVDFGDSGVNRHYYEAAAWGYNVDRIERGSYPGLTRAEERRARALFLEHGAAFERWVRRAQESAWDHYGAFFAGLTSGGPTPRRSLHDHPPAPDGAP
jgi:hypothetical protein